jgi:hypothetical protein
VAGVWHGLKASTMLSAALWLRFLEYVLKNLGTTAQVEVSRMPLFQLCGDEAAEARSKYYLFPSPQAGFLQFNFREENPRNFAM